jgi:hypothetical protein
MSLLMLCPSRGRPDSAREVLRLFDDTVALDDTELRFLVDSDDETAEQYPQHCTLILDPPPGCMNNAMNKGALQAVDEGYDYIGFIGDDHRFRTVDWDDAFISQLRKVRGGMIFGNDLLQEHRLPTHIVMSSSIVKALGWMGLPGAKHLYLDNTWLSLGDAVQCLYYLPTIVIEHMHPAGGKAVWDESYQRVNAPALYEHDSLIYHAWAGGPQFGEDVAKVRAALE